MKTIITILAIALSATAVALGDDAIRGVCVDGDTERAFVISEVIPQKAVKGGWKPQVDYTEDGTTPKAIVWIEDSKVRPVVTLIGRFKDHEIIDLTFPESGGKETHPDQPFGARVLAYRVRVAATSHMLPFFVIMGDQVRWYEQVFTSGVTAPFLLEVSQTISGNGVMWANFTFGFNDNGALIKELSSGGRGQKTTVTKFRQDGTVASTEELDDN